MLSNQEVREVRVILIFGSIRECVPGYKHHAILVLMSHRGLGMEVVSYDIPRNSTSRESNFVDQQDIGFIHAFVQEIR